MQTHTYKGFLWKNKWWSCQILRINVWLQDWKLTLRRTPFYMYGTLFAQLNCQVDFVSLPSPFCQIAGSIFHNPLQHFNSSPSCQLQFAKIVKSTLQTHQVHIISGEPPECTLKLPQPQANKHYSMYIVYVLQSKKLSKHRSKRSPHSSLAFTSCLRVKHFSPPTKKRQENKSYPSSPTIYEVAIWKRCWLSDVVVCCQSSQIPR